MFPKHKNKTEFEKQKQSRTFNNFIRISSPTHSITFLLSYKCSQQYLIPSKSISSKKKPHKHTFLSSSHFHLFRHPIQYLTLFPLETSSNIHGALPLIHCPPHLHLLVIGSHRKQEFRLHQGKHQFDESQFPLARLVQGIEAAQNGRCYHDGGECKVRDKQFGPSLQDAREERKEGDEGDDEKSSSQVANGYQDLHKRQALGICKTKSGDRMK